MFKILSFREPPERSESEASKAAKMTQPPPKKANKKQAVASQNTSIPYVLF